MDTLQLPKQKRLSDNLSERDSQIINSVSKKIEYCAGSISRKTGVDKDDLIQDGYLYAIKSLDAHHKRGEVGFAAFINKHLNSHLWRRALAYRSPVTIPRREIQKGVTATACHDEIDKKQSDEPNPAEATHAAEVSSLLQAAINCLSPRTQRLVRARYFEGFSISEIARELGVSGAQTEFLIRQARKLLRADPRVVELIEDMQ